MSKFEREYRCIVVKLKDLVSCSPIDDPGQAERVLRDHLQSWHIPTRECVVVESDWPEYETVWGMIEARVTGQLSELEQLRTEAQALREEVAALRARVVVVPEWKPLTGTGQIKKGDLLRFAVAGKEIEAPAQLIINEGTGKEEIVYNRGKNHYFITSMAVDGTSSHKSVQVKSLNSKVVSEGLLLRALAYIETMTYGGTDGLELIDELRALLHP